ncbi:hypothetical protein ACA910_003979 [Epithemia clementina (nom. ined.)]
MSPRQIITGLDINYSRHCKAEFGDYIQTHEEHDNTMATRTIGALALRPTGNAQGAYYCLSLTTGRVIRQARWTALPMPNEVIDRVHRMAQQDGANDGLYFQDRDGNNIPDARDNDNEQDGDDESYHTNDDDNSSDDDDADADDDAASNDGEEANVDEFPVVEPPPPPADNEADAPNNNIEDAEVLDPAGTPGVIDPGEIPGVEGDVWGLEEVPSDPQVQRELRRLAINDEAPAMYVGRTRAQQRQINQTLIGESLEVVLTQARDPNVIAPTPLGDISTPQYPFKKGLEVFGEEGQQAVLEELQQLHERKVILPKEAADLTPEQKRTSLEYLMFIRRKRDGLLKGRGCADGRKQRLYTAREEASSPKVSIEALFLTCVIDAMEHRDVATVDIPGAFMQADMDEVVHMRLHGEMAELITKLEPKLYNKYVVYERGEPVIYVVLLKALYGTLRAALLFWQRLSTQLTKWGFVINPYNWCVANKTVNGKQCTIVWHIDDLKISHVDASVVTEIIGMLEQEFGKEAPLTIRRGSVHDYLGMVLDYSDTGKVKIQMFDYIQSLLNNLPPDMDGTSNTPAGEHLFTVNETNPELLDEATAELFHHNVVKLLFLCKRARPDLQTAVSFLCTRVHQPDRDDYKKLAKTMHYLRLTQLIPLTLESDDVTVIKWWIDGAFAVHRDMQSHTGGGGGGACHVFGEGHCVRHFTLSAAQHP